MPWQANLYSYKEAVLDLCLHQTIDVCVCVCNGLYNFEFHITSRILKNQIFEGIFLMTLIFFFKARLQFTTYKIVSFLFLLQITFNYTHTYISRQLFINYIIQELHLAASNNRLKKVYFFLFFFHLFKSLGVDDCWHKFICSVMFLRVWVLFGCLLCQL